MTPGGASGYPTTLESLSHVADSLHTRRGRCETGEKETLRISTDYAGFFSYVVFYFIVWIVSLLAAAESGDRRPAAGPPRGVETRGTSV